MPERILYKPGEFVRTFTGEWGLVIGPEELAPVIQNRKEARRPGSFFAPGCCHRPDYITQVPVLFEDGTFDVMRSVSLKRDSQPPDEVQERIRGMRPVEER